MTTLNKVLIGLLVVQVGLVGLCSTRDRGATIGKLEPLLPDYDVDSVTHLQIFSGEGETAASEPAIDLVKKGDEWVLASHFDYPADSAAVSSLIGKIATMQSRGPATTTSSGHKRLKVADDAFVRKIVLTNAAGDTTVYFGISPTFKKLNIRLAGSDNTYLVQQLTPTDADDSVSSWIDPVYLQIPVDAMVALSVENEHGLVSLERDADRRWQLAPGTPLPPGKTVPVSVDQKAVADLAQKLSKIEIENIAGTDVKPGFGLDQPVARVTIGMAGAKPEPAGESQGSAGETEDSSASDDQGDSGEAAESQAPSREVRVLEIGAEKDGARYLRVLDKPYIVTVKKAALKEAVDLAIDKVLDDEAPPPVTPQP